LESKEASRNYRERKKKFTEELQERMAKLQKEKVFLQQEKDAIARMVEKLNKDNEAIKTDITQKSMTLQVRLQKILESMRSLILNNASENQIAPVLQQYFEVCQMIFKYSTCHLEILLSPSITNTLVKKGFFKEAMQAKVESGSAFMGKIDDVIKLVLNKVPDLTETQITKIKEFVALYQKKLEPLHQERDILNQELEILLEKQTEKVLSQGPTIIGDKKNKKIYVRNK